MFTLIIHITNGKKHSITCTFRFQNYTTEDGAVKPAVSIEKLLFKKKSC